MKNKEIFSSIIELSEYFSDEKTCLNYLKTQRWGDKVTCPHCESDKIYEYKNGIHFHCKSCNKRFTAKIGTIYEGSKLPMKKWIIALYLFIANKKGISSHGLARMINVTQKTAWYMLHRLRSKFGVDNDPNEELNGVIEIDETFVGGKNKNRHKNKKTVQQGGRSFIDKTPVLGMLQRGGKVRTMVIPSTQREYIQPIVEQVAQYGCTLITDEWKAYSLLGNMYNHYCVDHSKGQYVNGEVHTNNIEGFWNWIKRMIVGTYHNISKKHLQQYAHEATFRYNTRAMSDCERLQAAMSLKCKQLKYINLIS